MTILAIMSIVLALCGATVTAIKETRAAWSDRVRDLVTAASEAVRKIDANAGIISQERCTQDDGGRRASKKQVHDEALAQKAKFDKAHVGYDQTIWVPIIVLYIVATGLVLRLTFISNANFKETITAPPPADVLTLRIALVGTFIVNAFAGYRMHRSLKQMQVQMESLKKTAITFDAANLDASGQQLLTRTDPPSEDPPKALPAPVAT